MFFAKAGSTVVLGLVAAVAYYHEWTWTSGLAAFASLVIWAGPLSLDFFGRSAERRDQERCVSKVPFNEKQT
jgi:hypothetical protein